MAITAPTVRFTPPMLVPRGSLPTGPGWAFEVEWDGIRGQAAVLDGRGWVALSDRRAVHRFGPEGRFNAVDVGARKVTACASSERHSQAMPPSWLDVGVALQRRLVEAASWCT